MRNSRAANLMVKIFGDAPTCLPRLIQIEFDSYTSLTDTFGKHILYGRLGYRRFSITETTSLAEKLSELFAPRVNLLPPDFIILSGPGSIALVFSPYYTILDP